MDVSVEASGNWFTCRDKVAAAFSGDLQPGINSFRPRQKRDHFADDISKHFLEWNLLYFYSDFTEMFVMVQLKIIRIGPDNGLVPNRRQANIRINDDIVYWRIYAYLGLNELTPHPTITDKDLFRKSHWKRFRVVTCYVVY